MSKTNSKYEYIRLGYIDREENTKTNTKRISGRVTSNKSAVFEQGDFFNLEPITEYVNRMVELGYKTPEAGAEELANTKKTIRLEDGTNLVKETLYSITLVKPKERKNVAQKNSF
jgi:hypothetical protein